MKKVSLVICIIFSVLAISVTPQENESTAISNFLSRGVEPLREARTSRRIEVRNEEGKLTGLLEVETELRGNSFSYNITREEGSWWIKNFLFKNSLEKEKKYVKENSASKRALTHDNYTFIKEENLGEVWQVWVEAKRKDEGLINGYVLIGPDWKLLRSEGALVDPPRFTRDPVVTFAFEEIMGVRVPVSFDSKGSVRVMGFGLSNGTVSGKYKYLSVNDKPVMAAE